jgi:hypothetical protein
MANASMVAVDATNVMMERRKSDGNDDAGVDIIRSIVVFVVIVVGGLAERSRASCGKG